MRGLDDLPLFRWQPPTCEVIPFPAARRLGKIRRTVEVLSDKSGRGAERYWRQVIDGLRSQMNACGLSQADIDRELREFAEQVSIRLPASLPKGGDAA